ncbi:DUF6220 domain-containing protein [Nostoc sp. PA-18-2419]|uniref:DUF6220 domain-containing protein n=1 Tax=Nostoc sp. PA-18-2419 TaxID=2575443 RepID=UPI0011099E4E|nr:DUF6220 domain-containing protein [Nostoc sp. PA-18-2419]
MIIDFHSQRTQLSGRWTRIGFLAIAVLFNLCLVAQLLTVGLAVFYNPTWWSIHVWLVRRYSGLAVLLLAGLLISPFSQKIQMLTGGLVTLLILQFATIHLNFTLPLGVLHPLIGFLLFTSSTTLVHQVWRVVFNESGTVTSAEH